MEDQTKRNARILKEREEEKIRTLINLLIDLQLNKLESKLTYLEEYEKFIWYEKNQLEVYQKMILSDKVKLSFERNELTE